MPPFRNLSPDYSISWAARRSAEQPLTQEFLGELVDVALVPGSAAADGDNEHDNFSPLNAIHDPVALADGPNTAKGGELSNERLALLLRRARQLIRPLTDEPSDPLVGNGFDELEGRLRPRDREGAISMPDSKRVLS